MNKVLFYLLLLILFPIAAVIVITQWTARSNISLA